MPRGDRTGPLGYGPMTGRGMGYCGGFTDPGFMHPGPGYAYGRGRGFGRGRGWRYAGFGHSWGYPYPPATPYSNITPFTEEQEMDILEEQAKMLEEELNQIRKRQKNIKRQKQEK